MDGNGINEIRERKWNANIGIVERRGIERK